MIKRSLGELGINTDIHPLKYWENNYNQGYIDEENILNGFVIGAAWVIILTQEKNFRTLRVNWML